MGDGERLLKEVSIMLDFSHPNVMPLIGLCLDRELPLLIMPFMWRGTVLDYVKKSRSSLYFSDGSEDSVEVSHFSLLFNNMCAVVGALF